MRIVQVVPSVEEEASGPSYSVPRLAKALSDLGDDVHLLTVGGQALPPYAQLNHSRFSIDWEYPSVIKTLWISRNLDLALKNSAQDTDIFHSHGMWAMPNIYPGYAARRAGKPFVVSPRGTLGVIPLSYSRFRKRVFWTILQGAVVRGAQCLHATSEQEYREIRAFGLDLPVTVIPNGIDIPVMITQNKRKSARRLLFLGRVHPKKGLENLIGAWSRIEAHFPEWELRIVGPGSRKYVGSLQSLVEDYGLHRVSIPGALYGPEKSEECTTADVHILPSLNENFGMSVAEALAHGRPIITTTGTPWSGVLDNRCGWWIEPTANAIEDTLREALAMAPVEHDLMGARGRAWMLRDYSWSSIAKKMQITYRWLVHGGRVPDTVHLD